MKPLKIICAISIIIPVCLFLIATAAASADDTKAREIMQKVEDRDDGDNQISEMEMILIDKFNQRRVRRLSTFTKDKGKDNLRMMFFLHPADVKNTAFLVYDYDSANKDDDQWLYLPALRKSKRIASSDQSGSFMGSDLNYADMTSRNLEDFEFFLKKEMSVNGHNTWLIESIPRSKKVIAETGYTKSWLFIRQDNYVMVRAVRWVDESGYLKYIDVKNLERIDGIWVSTEIHIAKKQGKRTVHQTILKHHNVKFNQDLKESFFSVRQMEKGL